MHFDVFVCHQQINTAYSLFTSTNCAVQCGIYKSSVYAWNRHSSVPDWNGVYLLIMPSVTMGYF